MVLAGHQAAELRLDLRALDAGGARAECTFERGLVGGHIRAGETSDEAAGVTGRNILVIDEIERDVRGGLAALRLAVNVYRIFALVVLETCELVHRHYI